MLITKETLAAAIPQHRSVREIAKTYGTTVNAVYRKVKEYGLSLDELMDRFADQDDTPSPEEIAAAAAEIRKSWSPAETARRIVGGGPKRWRPPAYKVGELVGVTAMSRRSM